MFRLPKQAFLRLLLVTFLAFLYLTAWKSLRSFSLKAIVNEETLLNSPYIEVESHHSHRIKYRLTDSIMTKSVNIKFPYGLFFFISISAMIFFKLNKRYYLILLIIQTAVGLSALFLFMLGVLYGNLFLISSDLFGHYLLPLLTLAVPVYGLSQRKQNG